VRPEGQEYQQSEKAGHCPVAAKTLSVEVESGKKGILEARRLARTQDRALASRIGTYLYIKRTFAWDIELESKIASLTPAEVNAALKKYIDPAKVSLVSAGDFKK